MLSCSRLSFQSLGNSNRLIASIGTAIHTDELPSYMVSLDTIDPVAPLYRDATMQESCLDFFSALSGSTSIAKAILDNALRFQVPASLAFALAFEESHFQADAINHNGGSIDRGLFQLNSRSFPELKIADFYDPEINARYGLAHLHYCLAASGNEVAALAMYNAGRTSVDRGVTPRRTLDYVSRIMKYEDNIRTLFEVKVASRAEVAAHPKPTASSEAFAPAADLSLSLALGQIR
ncbi:MAG TPA: transglycosylase SLT domain-containing protein [Rectinemataceae bacterium]|nr:transglycosylase SLT domain-containing protein [Rectinemataceae bacterium]